MACREQCFETFYLIFDQIHDIYDSLYTAYLSSKLSLREYLEWNVACSLQQNSGQSITSSSPILNTVHNKWNASIAVSNAMIGDRIGIYRIGNIGLVRSSQNADRIGIYRIGRY